MNRKIVNISKLIQIFLVTVMISGRSTYGVDLPNKISDYAGNGQIGYDDGTKMEATFNSPYALALDKDGGILVVDTGNSLIRKIKDDKVSTIAGSVYKDDVNEFGFPNGGYIDGEALQAKFNNPRGIAVDSKGNIFVADTGNNVIRKIREGKVYTFAGDGKAGYKDGSNTEAEFNNPSFIIVDKKDNLYVSDTLNNVIRIITPEGDVKTYAGIHCDDGGYKDGNSSTAIFNEPSGIALDKDGIMFVLDTGNQVIRKIENNSVSTLCGVKTDLIKDTNYYQGDFHDGNSNEAKFNFPKGICITPNNYILIADTFNNRIRVVDEKGKTATIAGTGEVGRISNDVNSVTFNEPMGLIYSNDNLYVCDNLNNLIRAITICPDNLSVALATYADSNSDKAVKSNSLSDVMLVKTKDIQIWINKKQIKFSINKPYSINGKIYVPLREVCEAYGAKVSYNNATKEIAITKGNFVKKFSNDNVGQLLVKKKSVNYIELRQVSEILSLNFELEEKYNAVIMSDRK